MENNLDTQVINGSEENTENNNEASQTQQEESKREYTALEKQYYERNRKLEAENLALKTANKNTEPVEDDKWRDKIELMARGYTNDKEIDFLLKNGGIKALEDDFIKNAIKLNREEEERKAKVSFGTSSKSGLNSTVSQDQIRTMSASEMEMAILKGKIK